MSDEYSLHGTWQLEEFDSKLEEWLVREHPSTDLYEQVKVWWPLMRYASERSPARPADDQATAEGGGEDEVFVMLAPNCHDIDEVQGWLGVLVIFELFEVIHVVRCRAFHTIVRMTPTEIDRADGRGTG